MAVPPIAQPLGEGTDADDGEASQSAFWAAVYRRIAPGAVFRIPDSVTGRTMKEHAGRSVLRPAVILGGVPSPSEAPAIALTRKVALSTRISWKEHFGTIPTTEEEVAALAGQRGWVFTRAGLLAGFSTHGVFELQPRRWATMERLISVEFMGWLPRPAVDLILRLAVGATVPSQYPPSDSVHL
jgi:hypothetical protein